MTLKDYLPSKLSWIYMKLQGVSLNNKNKSVALEPDFAQSGADCWD